MHRTSSSAFKNCNLEGKYLPETHSQPGSRYISKIGKLSSGMVVICCLSKLEIKMLHNLFIFQSFCMCNYN